MGDDAAFGPPRAACDALKTVLETKQKVKDAWAKIKKIVVKVVETIAMIRWGRISLKAIAGFADIIGAELIAAIGSAAAAMAKAALEGLSEAAAAILEAIFSRLLAILLAYPDAIFSLVAIPLDFSTESGERERYHLRIAQYRINHALYIINKWTKGLDGTKFYEQMKNSFPYIIDAMAIAQDMIDELEDEDREQSGEERNAVFNESKYRALLSNLGSAIDITTPSSTIAKRLRSVRLLTAQWDDEKRKKLKTLNIRYKVLRRALDKEREDELLALGVKNTDDEIVSEESLRIYESAGGDAEFLREFVKNANKELGQAENLEDAISLARIDLRWAKRITKLEANKKIEEAEIEADSEFKKITDNSKWAKIYQGVEGEFKYDMNELGNALTDFLDHTKKAFIQYKLCQGSANVVYTIRAKILTLIEYAISLLRKFGNFSAGLAIKALQVAYIGMSVTKSKFEVEINNFEESADKRKTSAAKMSTTVVACNVVLQASESTLNGAITKSMIGLINADDMLEAENEQFNEFLENLASITDLKGEQNIWAVQPSESKFQNQYVQLIANATSMITKVPLLSMSFSESSKQDAAKLIRETKTTFSTLKRHNSEVLGVLYSYTPYQCPEAGELTDLLNKLGLLAVFATSLDLKGLVKGIINLKKLPGQIGNLVPTVGRCDELYGTFKDSPEAAAIAKQEKQNVNDFKGSTEAGKSNEDKENDRNVAISTEETLDPMSRADKASDYQNGDSVYNASDVMPKP